MDDTPRVAVVRVVDPRGFIEYKYERPTRRWNPYQYMSVVPYARRARVTRESFLRNFTRARSR